MLTLKPLAVRVPAEVEKEICEIIAEEKLDKATVVRKLLEIGMRSGESRQLWNSCRGAK
jgi:hypothetical protein